MNTHARVAARDWRALTRLLLALLLTVVIAAGATLLAPAARATDASVVRELTERRTQYSSTYLLSDDTYRTVFYQSPAHFKDAAGAWQEIDPSLIPSAGIDVFTTAAAPVEVTVADEAPAQKPILVETGGFAVTMNLIDYAESDKVILGDSALYLGVAPDTDVTYTALGDGVKEVITLASSRAPNQFRYRLTHPGLELRRDESGQWALFEPGKASPLFLVGAVNASDSSQDEAGEPAWCDGAAMTVVPGEGASTITYSLPRAWLDDPGRVWPVKIDPNLFTRNPTDTYISAGYPGTAYGSSESLFGGNVSTSTGTCKTLVKFPQVNNTSNIPAGAHISSATFSIRCFWQPTTNNDSVSCGKIEASGSTLWGDASTWNSTTLNVTHMTSQNVQEQEWFDVSCLGCVQYWITHDAAANKGFCVYESSTAASYAKKFRSGEYADTTYRPKLSVDWEEPAASVSCDRSGSAYRLGDTAKVFVDLSGVADVSQVTDVRMGINRYQTADLARRRGVLGWFSSNPGGSWVRLATSNFYYFNSPADYGTDHITPDLSQCSFDTTTKRVTFAFKLNDEASGTGDFKADFGDCQDNDFDTIIDMSSGSESWSSGWVHHNTNMDVQPTAPEHPTSDLGQFADHEAEAVLDQQALRLSTSDLTIASWGPEAAVSRSYSSARSASSLTAPGWRFGFERCLTAASGSGAPSAAENFVNYYDEAGDRYVFLKRTSGSYAYIAPKGFSAVLAQSGSNWTLTVDDGLVSTFNAAGQLVSEKDRNNQTVSYGYTGTQLTSITAANGQSIALTYSSGKLATATYAVAGTSRQVSYATASPWRVTYYPGQGPQRKVLYFYDAAPRLTRVTVEDWPSAGSSAYEDFAYAAGVLTDVYLPGYNQTTRADAHLSLSYDETYSAAENETSATVRRYSAAGGQIGYSLLTWRDASGRLIAGDTYVGSTRTVASGASWTGAYCVGSLTTDPNDGPAATTSFTYETDPVLAVYGKALSSTDADQNVTTYTYAYDAKDPTGRLATEETPEGTKTWSTYDANGNLLAETKTFSGSSDKSRTEYAYDSYGRRTSEKRLISGTVTQNGSTFTVTNGVWAQTDYSNFAPCGEPQTIIARAVKLSPTGNPQDLTKTLSYDGFGNLLSETDWGGRATSASTYDVAGRRPTGTDAAGVTTTTSYDALGNATQSYRTVSGSSMKADWTVTTYDATGHELTVTTKLSDGSGNPTTQSVVTNTYDGLGRQLTSSDSTVGGQPEKWVYDAAGNVTEHWDLGVLNYSDAYRSTRTSYDAEGRTTGESAPGNSIAPGPTGVNHDQDPTAVGGSRTVYDDLGQVVREVNPDKSQVTYQYDGNGNETSLASTAAGTTTSSYGIDDRLATQTKNGFTTNSTYDMLGRTTGATGGSQSQTQTTYNTLGWVLSTVDASGVTTTKSYEAHGNVVSETIGSQGATLSTYDNVNRLLTRTDPNGSVLTNTYDGFGNLTEAAHEDWNGTMLKDVTTSYDSLGRPTSESESISGRSRTWTYPQNAVTGIQETIAFDGGPLTSTTVARNGRGMETSRTTTIAASTTLTRSVADTSSGRDRDDRWTQSLVQLTGYSALTLNRSFDDAGRQATQSGPGFSSAGSYSYNATSGLKSAQSLPLALGGTGSDSYTYSSDGRLRTWNGGPTYTFDLAGNLTGDTGLGTTFTYDGANRLTQSVSGGVTTVYGWDQGNAWRTSQGPSGNPTQIQYTYVKNGASTSNGRMTRYQNGGTATDAAYSYDASGQRVKSVVMVGSTTTTTDFVYDGLTLLGLSASQGQNTWRIDYLYNEEGQAYGGVYRSPADSTSPTAFTMITNDHSDVLELLDGQGNAFAAYRYDPWGRPSGSGNYATGIWTQGTGLVTSTLAGQIASRQVLRYAGYAWDGESGLYYCSARYYDASTRQWTTGDPAKADGEESAYQYCGGEPVRRVDPSGLFSFNDQEWKLALAHPVQAVKYVRAARFSLKRSQDFASHGYFGSNSLTNGIGDAFRHALWSAVLCHDIGIEATIKWTNAHEYGDDNNTARWRKMDLHNNWVGRSFYVRYSSHNMRNWTFEKKLIRESYWRKKLWWKGHGV